MVSARGVKHKTQVGPECLTGKDLTLPVVLHQSTLTTVIVYLQPNCLLLFVLH